MGVGHGVGTFQHLNKAEVEIRISFSSLEEVAFCQTVLLNLNTRIKQLDF